MYVYTPSKEKMPRVFFLYTYYCYIIFLVCQYSLLPVRVYKHGNLIGCEKHFLFSFQATPSNCTTRKGNSLPGVFVRFFSSRSI